ncbi:monofunctional biosynthetic peptidoglycan transglycosylase [Leptothrix cholodnii SP-6]|uniref:Biosynthetic peptidoglycan transglycosylase n=1 Tax=Leptothrix cholodnii (strain ATCC 51168 / LMG 8142 / SP-6) TaxID=395495 RepID=B1Y8H0_LEPCP|nr:transglycosylase domain-containing protein [Leptothrix cholodnii]ACB36236.1 monofunctional biosynthetic peptidoglycan transglycosylase [Leptothrix cholodnii SP-6]
MKVLKSHAVRLLVLLVLSGLALQLFFLARITAMRWIDPESTAFQRSEIWRLVSEQHQLSWSQRWVPYEQIADSLKRAVIASEDAGFVDHSGVEWDAIEKAWTRNQQAEARAEKLNEARLRREEQAAARRKSEAAASARSPRLVQPKVVGGSTISQQLAKNLFLSGERTTLRKGQELLITLMLETALPKARILEIYLNNVEWGEGLFGAQAAARHYFHIDAARLGAYQAARLAVMLPAPKRFEKRPDSAYVLGRSSTVAARMGAVELP